jgi:MFS family permease
VSSELPPTSAGVGSAKSGSVSLPHERRNFWLGVANGGMFQAGENLVDSSTVLPVLLSSLTRSHGLIGFAVALNDLGWMLPQFAAAPWVSRLPRQLPLYREMAILRGACLFGLAIAAWLLRGEPGLLLAAFFVMYGIFSAGAGIAGVAFMELVGRTIRHERLGAYFAQRMFWGGSLGALAGLVARQVLRLDDPGTRFAILFGLSAVACSLGLAAFSSIREPPHPVSPTHATPLALLRQGFQWLRHEAGFRRLLVARASLSVWLSAAPFLTLFVVDELEGGNLAAGTLLVSRLAGFVLSNLAWQRLSERLGNRSILRLSTGLACAMLIASALIAWGSPWRARIIPARTALVALELLAAVGGAAHSGILVAFNAKLIEAAPAGQRQGYVSVMYTFLGPTMLLPMLGGFLVDAVNAPFLFLVCGVVCVTGYVAASGLPGRGVRAIA